MPKADMKDMRAALFVEMNGKTFLVALPPERMELLLPLAASLADNGKLPLMPTGLFSFAAVREINAAGVEAAHVPQPSLLDVGFKYEDGQHTPTVLLGFAPGDFDARDAFVRALGVDLGEGGKRDA